MILEVLPVTVSLSHCKRSVNLCEMFMIHKSTRQGLRLVCLLLVHKVLCNPCNDGFYRSGGECFRCSTTCETCWTATICNRCKVGFYGDVCEFHCPVQCPVCTKNTGRCPVQCPVGYYTDTQKSCQKCPEHCKECNTTYCFDCDVGYRGNLCQEQCINCLPGTGCHQKGLCMEGCKDGLRGEFCNESCISGCLSCERFDEYKCLTCLPGQYGQTCQSECNDACRDNKCEKDDGSCSVGCKHGFSGVFCETQMFKLVATVAGLSVGVLILVLIVSFSVIICRKRMRDRSRKNQHAEEAPVPLMPVTLERGTILYRRRDDRTEDPEYDYVRPNHLILRKDFVAKKPEQQYMTELKSILECSKSLYEAKRQTHFLNDRLNASYIDDFDKLRAYIVCKAPATVNTLAETFWKMVVEEKCQHVVLITARNEKEDDRCWPTENNKELVFGDISVMLYGELRFPNYWTKEIELERRNKKTEVHQYTIHANVPDDVTSFVEFFGKNWYESSKIAGPVVVCSSSTSLCGIYIVLDMMVRLLESTDEISIIECVSHLLQQRLDLIQTVEEYQFLHDVLTSFVNRKMTKGRRSYVQR